MKISIKAYIMDESLSWEERYKQLEAHHREETEWLINHIQELKEDHENDIQTLYQEIRDIEQQLPNY